MADLPRDLRRRLVDVLAGQDVFRSRADADRLLEAALSELPRRRPLLNGLDLEGEPGDRALEVVSKCQRVGKGRENALVMVLDELLNRAFEDEVIEVAEEALTHLLGVGRGSSAGVTSAAAGGAATPGSVEVTSSKVETSTGAGVVPSATAGRGDFVMVSYARPDAELVRPLVRDLEARGLEVVWADQLPEETRWPSWAFWNLERARSVILACTPAYWAFFENEGKRHLGDPSHDPSLGRGVAQEIGWMLEGELARRDQSLVPVYFDGTSRETHGFRFTSSDTFRYPENVDRLAQYLRSVRPRAPVGSGSKRKEGADDAEGSDPLQRLRRGQVDSYDRRGLEARFVPLRLRSQGEDAGDRGPKAFDALGDLIAQAKTDAVLLVGEPGSGKTTLLRRLEAEVAAADLGGPLEGAPDFGTERDRIVCFVALNEYDPRDGDFEGFLGRRFERLCPKLGSLEDALRAGRVWLLLDGLNEMVYGTTPEARFEDLDRFLRDLKPGNRVVVTCRPQDLAAHLSFAARADVQPLDGPKVETFLHKYAPERAATAWVDLNEKDLLPLYRNPYRLSLLVDALTESGAIPDNQTTLLDGMVRRSLGRNLEKKNASVWLEPHLGEAALLLRNGQLPRARSGEVQGALLLGMARLAFDAQRVEPGGHKPVPRDRACLQLGAGDAERGKEVLAAANGCLLLEDRAADGWVQFPHQQVRAYFSARHWVATMDDAAFEAARKAERLDDPKMKPSLEEELDRLERDPAGTLAERPPTGWEEAAILAVGLFAPEDEAREDFVRRLLDADRVTAGRAVLGPGSEGLKLDEGVEDEVRAALVDALRDPEVEIRARIDAGEVLDDPTPLGYERRTSGDVPYLWPPTAVVPAGRYAIGSLDDEPGSFARERPQHRFDLDEDLVVACHPVTNAEFAFFKDAGGYDDEAWWPEGDARAWQRGELADTSWSFFVDELRRLSDERFADEVRIQGLSEVEAKVLSELRSLPREKALACTPHEVHPATRKQPRFWDDPRLNRPLQPVVGVCFFEARAYVLWLSHVSRRSVRLLTEREWEAAARGLEGRRWAPAFSKGETERGPRGRINTRELRLRRPSPIGACLEGRTREGIYDLSGNVWEWTDSPVTDHYGHDAPISEELLVVRGGSWDDPVFNARAAYRSWNPRDYQVGSLGFRVCFSPPPTPGS